VDRTVALLSETLFQSPSTKPIAVVLATLFALTYLAGIAGFTRAIHTGEFVIDTIITTLAATGFGWATFRMTKLGVVATDKGITIRSWLRTYFVDWDLIESFKSGSDIAVGDLTLRELLATPALQSYVVFKDGHHRVLVGLSATRFDRIRSKAKIQEMLEQLEVARRMHDSGGRSPNGGG
jgi:hypothetical protein